MSKITRLVFAFISITAAVMFSFAYAADSTSNIKIPFAYPRYPSQWTNTVAFSIQNWSTLVACPGTPGNSTAAMPYCPGINTPTTPVTEVNQYSIYTGTIPVATYNSANSYTISTGNICIGTAGSCSSATLGATINQNPYCPDLCLARRSINNTLSSTVPIVSSSVMFPSCPSGYVKVAEYNFQPEIIKTSASYNIPSPITWSDYQAILGIAGASCSNDFFSSPNSRTFRGCVYSGSADAARWIAIANSGLFSATPTTIDVNNTGFGNGYAGVWWDQYLTYASSSTGAAQTAINTSGWNGTIGDGLYSGMIYVCNSSVCNCQTHTGGWQSITNTVYSPSTSVTAWLHYGYVLLNCTVPANTYVRTSQSAPSTYVCARIQSRWQNSN